MQHSVNARSEGRRHMQHSVNARSEGRRHMQPRVLAVPPSLHFWHSLYETVVLQDTKGWGLLTVGRPHYEEIIYILSYRM